MNADLFLEPHQRRVVDEANELAVRIVRLREFMGAPHSLTSGPTSRTA